MNDSTKPSACTCMHAHARPHEAQHAHACTHALVGVLSVPRGSARCAGISTRPGALAAAAAGAPLLLLAPLLLAPLVLPSPTLGCRGTAEGTGCCLLGPAARGGRASLAGRGGAGCMHARARAPRSRVRRPHAPHPAPAAAAGTAAGTLRGEDGGEAASPSLWPLPLNFFLSELVNRSSRKPIASLDTPLHWRRRCLGVQRAYENNKKNGSATILHNCGKLPAAHYLKQPRCCTLQMLMGPWGRSRGGALWWAHVLLALHACMAAQPSTPPTPLALLSAPASSIKPMPGMRPLASIKLKPTYEVCAACSPRMQRAHARARTHAHPRTPTHTARAAHRWHGGGVAGAAPLAPRGAAAGARLLAPGHGLLPPARNQVPQLHR